MSTPEGRLISLWKLTGSSWWRWGSSKLELNSWPLKRCTFCIEAQTTLVRTGKSSGKTEITTIRSRQRDCRAEEPVPRSIGNIGLIESKRQELLPPRSFLNNKENDKNRQSSEHSADRKQRISNSSYFKEDCIAESVSRSPSGITNRIDPEPITNLTVNEPPNESILVNYLNNEVEEPPVRQ